MRALDGRHPHRTFSLVISGGSWYRAPVAAKNKKVLLVHPWICDFAAYDFWVKPLGLLYIGAFLRLNGYGVHLIDCLDPGRIDFSPDDRVKPPKKMPSGRGRFPRQVIPAPPALKGIPRRYGRYGIPLRMFTEMLRGHGRPGAILVTSAMTYWYPGVFEAIEICREVFPGVPVVLGGIYASLCPDHAQRHSGADVVVQGEGEHSLPPVLKVLFGDDPGFRVRAGDLDSYPRPAFDLVAARHQLPVLTSKGCPYRCTYCASRVLHPAFVYRDPVSVVDEIEHGYRTFGVRHFAFHDDALLTLPRDRAIPMLKEMIRRGLPLSYHCPNGLHLREVTPEIARLLFRAGFATIRFGLETACARRQRETGGKVNNDELRQAVAYLREAGYDGGDIGVYLLCGLPGQGIAEVRESIAVVRSSGAKPFLAEFSPIPGTALWEEAVASCPYPIGAEPLFHNNTLMPCRDGEWTEAAFQSLKRLTKDESGVFPCIGPEKPL